MRWVWISLLAAAAAISAPSDDWVETTNDRLPLIFSIDSCPRKAAEGCIMKIFENGAKLSEWAGEDAWEESMEKPTSSEWVIRKTDLQPTPDQFRLLTRIDLQPTPNSIAASELLDNPAKVQLYHKNNGAVDSVRYVPSGSVAQAAIQQSDCFHLALDATVLQVCPVQQQQLAIEQALQVLFRVPSPRPLSPPCSLLDALSTTFSAPVNCLCLCLCLCLSPSLVLH